MTLGEIIKAYRNDHKMSMDDFAKKSGLSKSYIHLLEKNKHPKTGKPIIPSIPTIKQAADAMGIDFDHLFSQIDGDVKVNQLAAPDLPPGAISLGRYRIPIVAVVAAGVPIYSEDNIIGYVDYDRDPHGEVFALRVKGDSMVPKIENGDLVIVDKSVSWEDNDIVIVRVNGHEGTCKRVKRYAEGISLISINPAYEPMYYSREQVEQLPVEVVGRVMEVRSRL